MGWNIRLWSLLSECGLYVVYQVMGWTRSMKWKLAVFTFLMHFSGLIAHYSLVHIITTNKKFVFVIIHLNVIIFTASEPAFNTWWQSRMLDCCCDCSSGNIMFIVPSGNSINWYSILKICFLNISKYRPGFRWQAILPLLVL